MKTITNILIATLLLIVGVWGMGKMYDANMQAHCTNLNAQAIENADNIHYYITALDYKECREVYNITINAPVK